MKKGNTTKNVLLVVNTGGHLTQALCVMSVIDTFELVTSIDLENDIGASKVTIIKSTQHNPFKHFLNIFRAYKIIKQSDPVSIFSTGGPICIPFAVASRLTRTKFVYLDTLSRVIELSNTAAFLYRFHIFDEMYCQWPDLINKYPRIKYYGKTFDICNDGNKSIPISENDELDTNKAGSFK